MGLLDVIDRQWKSIFTGGQFSQEFSLVYKGLVYHIKGIWGEGTKRKESDGRLTVDKPEILYSLVTSDIPDEIGERNICSAVLKDSNGDSYSILATTGRKGAMRLLLSKDKKHEV